MHFPRPRFSILAGAAGLVALLYAPSAAPAGSVTFVLEGAHSVRLRVSTRGDRRVTAPCDSLSNTVVFDGELAAGQPVTVAAVGCICFERTTGSSRIDWAPAQISCRVPDRIVIQN